MKSFTKIICVLMVIIAICCGLSACKNKCADGHEWKLTSTTATCLESGVESYSCKTCKETKTDNVAAYGHDMAQSSYTAPTCKTNGESVDKCSRCGFESKQTLLVIDCDYQVKSATPSTCTVKGSQTLECSMCHETKTEALELKSHEYELKNTVDSTCIVHGYEYYECKDCTASRSEELQFAEHKYETATKQATCFTHGGTVEKCSVCQDEKPLTETPLLTHNFSADGYCTHCGIYKTLFDESKLNVIWYGNIINQIQGELVPRFKTNGTISDSYWQDHKITLAISLYDSENNLLETHSFNSVIIPQGTHSGKFTIQYMDTTGEIYDLMPNAFVVLTGESNMYALESRQNCKSFKIEISCDGYETIEKTYNI